MYVLCAQSLSCVRVFAMPWTVAHKAPLSMGFSRQEYWSGLPCPPPGGLPNPGIEPKSPPLQAVSLPSEPPGKESPCEGTGVLLIRPGTGSLRSRPVQSSCLPGAGPVSETVKSPLWVLDTNPARAQTLFACLQPESEAWGRKQAQYTQCLPFVPLVMSGRRALWG